MCVTVEYSTVDYFVFIFVCFVFCPYFVVRQFLKMFSLNEEQRWYIVNEWKKGSTQRELESAIDEALHDLSLNVVQACIKKDSENI